MRGFRIHRSPLFKKISKVIVAVLTLSVIMFSSASTTEAAQLTSLRAIFRRLKGDSGTPVNSEGIVVFFATPTGIQAGSDTITLTFSADFTLAAEVATNFDLAMGNSGTCTSATYTEETVVTTGATSTDWNVDVTGQVVTFSPATSDTLTAGFCIRMRMGLDAVTGGTGSAATVTNGDVDNDDLISFAGGIGDTGTLAVDLITDDQVTITATVDPTITFTITDNAIGFGTLSSTAARWANGAATGSGTDTSAHDLTIATNATSGYAVTYNGATLTSGGNTIDPASITNDADGTQGTEQFALGFSTSGDATIASGYDHNATPGNRDWNFVASTTTTIVSETVATNTETISAFYLSNIGGATEAGAYSTTLTYIATGTF